MTAPTGLYIQLFSIHGLVRGKNIELGRDVDTGGQIKYVIELAQALSKHPEIDRVDLITRQIFDNKVSDDYAVPEEQIADNAYIVRLPFGPKRYLRKEVLWPFLDSLADQALHHIRRIGRVPDIIHTHYADAGYVGTHLSSLLEVPLVHTGHSLGRVKSMRLMDSGLAAKVIEKQYHMSQRIEAEEVVLDNAALIVTSTEQEIHEQYRLYDNNKPRRMVVIPPGVDLAKFFPPRRPKKNADLDVDRRRKTYPVSRVLKRFLQDERKPMILAISRADVRKNITTLVRAYGENKALQEKANLVIIAGARDVIAKMPKEPRDVLKEILLSIDQYDLYGKVAYPKNHATGDIADLYRLVTMSKGVFVNPAYIEPFGLTLLEAAASGAPIVATEDGGPRDIIKFCKNGVLIDPLDSHRLGEVLLDALCDRKQWMRWSKNGIKGAQDSFSWPGHVNKYMREIARLVNQKTKTQGIGQTLKSRLPVSERMLVCDIDNTLIGDEKGLAELIKRLSTSKKSISFGVATGRRIDSAKKVLKKWGAPIPDFFITAVGSEIHYGSRMIEDANWQRHIDYLWDPEKVIEVMKLVAGIRMQPKIDQRTHKISYYINTKKAPDVKEIIRHLRKNDLHVNVIYSHQAFIDILPVRASKGAAVRYLAVKWGIEVEDIVVAGDSGNDEEMLRGDLLGVVVGNHSDELKHLKGQKRVYFSKGHYAAGITEGMEHFGFL